MNEMTCQSCGKPTAGAKLCTECSKTLAIALINVAAYYDDLASVEAKTTHYAVNTGAIAHRNRDDEQQGDWQQGAPEKPLPVDMRFLDTTGDGTQVKWDVWNSVVTWCRVVMEEAGSPLTEPACRDCIHPSCTAIRRQRWPRNTVRSMVAYFDRQYRFIVRMDWVGDFLDEMLDNEKRMRRLIDRPADRWYAGKCSVADEYGECEAELYAIAGAATVTCQACGIQHNVSERRDVLLKEAEEYHVTASEAAKALITWTDYDGTETKLVDRIRRWRDRDQLEVRDVTSLNGRDRHLYRLGDVQTLLLGSARRSPEPVAESA